MTTDSTSTSVGTVAKPSRARKTRSRFRYFQKKVPSSLRETFGRSHFNHYVSIDMAADANTVQRIKQRWELAYDVWFDEIRAAPEGSTQRQNLIEGHEPRPMPSPEYGESPQALARWHRDGPHAHDWYGPGVVGIERLRVQTESLSNAPSADAILAPMLANPDMPRIEMQGLMELARVVARGRTEKLPALRALLAKIDASEPQAIGPGMNALFDLWVEKRGATIIVKHKHTVRRWIEVNGGVDTPVKSITRAMVDAFYRANASEKLGPAAQTKHRDHLKAMLQIACAEGWIDTNPAQHVTLSAAVKRAAVKDDDEDDGKSFSPAQLATLLDAAAIEWKDEPDKLLAFRMLVWTGARSNEICQLRVDQVKTSDDGIPYIRLRVGPGQSLKNPKSKRNVPLHASIAADVLAHSGHGYGPWLFPSFPHKHPKKHNAALQAAFNGRWVAATKTKPAHYVGLLRGVVGITDPELTLHGTRHAFKDAMTRARVEKNTRKEVMGHGKGCVHDDYGIEILELANEAVQYTEPLNPKVKPRPARAAAA